MKYRRFTPDFRRSLIEQLLSETATPLELCRRYNISSGQLYTWKRQYAQGKLNLEPSRESELAARVRKLERLLGKVTLENEFLKKAVRNSLKEPERKRGFITRLQIEYLQGLEAKTLGGFISASSGDLLS
jgi:transposase